MAAARGGVKRAGGDVLISFWTTPHSWAFLTFMKRIATFIVGFLAIVLIYIAGYFLLEDYALQKPWLTSFFASFYKPMRMIVERERLTQTDTHVGELNVTNKGYHVMISPGDNNYFQVPEDLMPLVGNVPRFSVVEVELGYVLNNRSTRTFSSELRDIRVLEPTTNEVMAIPALDTDIGKAGVAFQEAVYILQSKPAEEDSLGEFLMRAHQKAVADDDKRSYHFSELSFSTETKDLLLNGNQPASMELIGEHYDKFQDRYCYVYVYKITNEVTGEFNKVELVYWTSELIPAQ